jgi:hypothetical protein
MGFYDRVYFGSKKVTKQHKMLTLEAAREVGLTRITPTQGSWSGADLSAGTHSGSGALDISVRNIPVDKRVPFVVAMRKRGAGATWVRSRKYGWTRGDHIHSMMGCGDSGDDPMISASGKRQVAQWKRGLNGLANGARDPHPRPKIWPLTSWGTIENRINGKYRAVPSANVLRVQKALAKYVGLDYSSGPGFWGKRTQEAWAKARAKSDLSPVDLFMLLGYRYGYRPGR